MAQITIPNSTLTRKQILLTEARRKRNAWVESARDGSGISYNQITKKTISTSSTPQRQDVALELLLDSGVTTSLPSSANILNFLGETIIDANDGNNKSNNDFLIDTPIGTMEASEIPVPTIERMPGSTPYEIFLAKLKHPSASEVVKSLERFISHMEKVDVSLLWEPLNDSSKGTDDFPDGGYWKESVAVSSRPPVLIRSFLDRLGKQMRDCPLWCPAMESVADGSWDNALQSVESFLHRKIRHRIFGQTIDDQTRDVAIAERISSLGFLEAKHLDIQALQVNGAQVQWDKAIQYLRDIEQESGPSSKMDKIVQCSKEVTRVLTLALGGELPGADDFLPAMILVLKLANPKQLQSNLTFIQEYCPEKKMISESGYIFTHVSSALSFLMEVDASQLTIDPQLFEKELKKHSKKAKIKGNELINDQNGMKKSLYLKNNNGEEDNNYGDENEDHEENGDGKARNEMKEISIQEMRKLWKEKLLLANQTSSKTSNQASPKKTTASNPFAKFKNSSANNNNEKSAHVSSQNEALSPSAPPLTIETTHKKNKNNKNHKTPLSSYNPFQPPDAMAPQSVKSSEVRSKYKFLACNDPNMLTFKQAGELLEDYKDLAKFCELLLVEREEARDMYLDHLRKES